MTIRDFVTECHVVAALRDREGGLTQNVLDALDNLGDDFRVTPRMMVLHAVDRLRHVTPEEVDAAPGLAVAHWLVLGELIPEDKEFRRFWAVRAGQMGFTAKSMRVELAGALELQRRAAAGEIVLRERLK